MKIFVWAFRLLFIAIMAAFSGTAYAQSHKYTISGYLKDGSSTESLIGASIYNQANKLGTSSNQYGFYSLTLPAGDVELIFSYVGYGTNIQKFNLKKDTLLNINLNASEYLGEVEITATKTASIRNTTQMSSANIPVTQIKAIPAFFGEVDVLKVLQLMPGVQSGSEGSSGLYVRGGGPDQNLILLDGVPLYNVSHLFGFFSVFNADAINNVEIFKGGFPSYYGGRVSSVVDINMKEGNMQKFHGEGSVGFISAKMTLEGPIIKDKTSFIVSARRTYIDLLLKPIIASAQSGSSEKFDVGYYFYDLTAKINHRFSAKDRIYLSLYTGDDKFYADSEFNSNYHTNKSEYNSKLSWGNIITAFRWNHLFTNKLFSNTTITYSRYRFLTDIESRETYEYTDYSYEPPKTSIKTDYYGANYNSGIKDWSAKIAFDYIPSPNHYVRFGASAIYHTFNPGAMAFTDTRISAKYGAQSVYGFEYSAYIGDDVKLTDRLKTNLGLHWSGFSVRDRFYNVLQPRVSARYLLTDEVSMKASYSRMAQYIHLLTNSNIGLPTDLWVPATDVLKPQTSHQVALGIVRDFAGKYEISIEGYYKTMKNVLEYKEGSSFINTDNNWENKVLQGNGTSYGVELFARKNLGSLTGWLGYTLSWTDRHFAQLNEGKPFWYKYDRRHDLSLVVTNRFSKRIEMSGTWVFGTGNCISIPIAVYQLPDPVALPSTIHNEYYDFSKRGNYRMEPYHRMDVSISFIKQRKKTERRWVISVFNVYNHKNPFYMDIRAQYSQDNNYRELKRYEYVQYSLFPIIPSVSYQLKF
ncbi:MAG: TonB-dependent receptor [Prevotellaceae bacterium]|jgi:outer membrane cobalamin receptor|nr:TonB-dependent receptor [Prevotellaceae bacterium]